MFQRIFTLLLSLTLSADVLAGMTTAAVGNCCRGPVSMTSVHGGVHCHQGEATRAQGPAAAPIAVDQDGGANCGHACPQCLCGGTPILIFPLTANDSVVILDLTYIAPWYRPATVPVGQVTRLERPPSARALS